MGSEVGSLLYLRVIAEQDPGALARVLERFQNLNVVPVRVLAEWAAQETLQVEVQLAGVTEDTIELIAAKLSQVPCIVNAYWHR